MGITPNSVEPRGETGEAPRGSPEKTQALVVKQPRGLQHLMETLNILSDLPERISETMGEDNARDLGGVGGGMTGAQGQGASFRDQALRSLPATEVMRTRLTRHLQNEIRELERSAHKFAQSARQGTAYLLNELYAKIRRIQTLIVELMEAAEEVVRRLYIRLFIDHQQLV